MNLKNWFKKGFVSVEAVITGAIILSVGFVAITNMTVTGGGVVTNSLNKLDVLGVFEVGEPVPAPGEVETPEGQEELTVGFTFLDYFSSTAFYQGDYETVDFPMGTKVLGVVLNLSNTTQKEYIIQSARVMYPNEVLYSKGDWLKNEYYQNLAMKPIGESTSGALYFEAAAMGPYIPNMSKADLTLELTFTNGEVLTLTNLIGQ